LKENVIMGRLIPAVTGMDYYRNVRIDRDETAEQKSSDRMEDLADIELPDIPPLSVHVPVSVEEEE
ncbi:MAG: hypothetical protein ACRD4L_07860, partial [Pyrinomonadaceae bacterium]